MDEQVVPSFVVPSKAAPSASPKSSLRRSATVPALAALVPSGPTPKDEAISPAPEFPGKPRWETPLRALRQRELWQGARELGLDVCVRSAKADGVGAVVRGTVADVVVAYVGPALPRATVEKWLCLLSEYLELNADEQVLVVCLLRKYVACGGRFVGQGDWARPQRWECIVAVACYLAVLLTEEFPGRTAMDLRELLGPNFRFGSEQVSFLKIVDWRISIDSATFNEVREACENVMSGDTAACALMMEWFQVDKALADRKKQAEEEAAAAAAAAAALAAQSPPVGKKRSYAAIAPADDSVVPRIVVPKLEPHLAKVESHLAKIEPHMGKVDPHLTIPAAYVATVPHWLPPHW